MCFFPCLRNNYFFVFYFTVYALFNSLGFGAMEIQTKPLLKIRTPKIKCIISHKSYPDVIVCMFTGEINIFDPVSLQLKRTIGLLGCPIRTGVVIPSKDIVLLGTDEGTILVLDLGNFNIIETIKAHDDFIRKIAVDEVHQRLLTVSDDNRTKLWSYKDGVVLIHRYKDSKHFVMDACFCPGDLSQFITVSLDTKIRLYSVLNTKCIKTFKGHTNGINTVDFVNNSTFVTGADDLSMMVWDLKSTLPLATLREHSGNITKIRGIQGGFISCSEDCSVKFWNSDFKCYNTMMMGGRVWDAYNKDGRIFVGSDDELGVFQVAKSTSKSFLCDNKVFYNCKGVFYSTKINDFGAFNELANFDENFTDFQVSKNGKLVAVFCDGKFVVYSILGMRKKFSGSTSSFLFFDSDSFASVQDYEISVVKKFEVCNRITIPGIEALLTFGETTTSASFLAVVAGHVCHCSDGKVVHNFGVSASRAVIIHGYYVLISSKVSIFDSDYVCVQTYDLYIESYVVSDSVLYFSTASKSHYLILSKDAFYLGALKHLPGLFGASGDTLLYSDNEPKKETIDLDLIVYQRVFLNDRHAACPDSVKDKAILFLQSMNFHEEALLLCENENQKFEILLSLGRLEEAFRSANSRIKYRKLGEKFYKEQNLAEAAECFYRANDLENLFYTDVKSSKKYLDYVTEASKKAGKFNLAFLSAYKSKNYEECRNLLKDTPFITAFNEFY